MQTLPLEYTPCRECILLEGEAILKRARVWTRGNSCRCKIHLGVITGVNWTGGRECRRASESYGARWSNIGYGLQLLLSCAAPLIY